MIGRDDGHATNIAAAAAPADIAPPNSDIIPSADIAAPSIEAVTNFDEPAAAVATQAEAPEIIATRVVAEPP